jgi:hypothetical protein
MTSLDRTVDARVKPGHDSLSSSIVACFSTACAELDAIKFDPGVGCSSRIRAPASRAMDRRVKPGGNR